MLIATGLSGSIGRHIRGIDSRIRLLMSLEDMKMTLSSHENIESILHLASTTNIRAVASDKDENFEVNVKGSLRLMEAFIANGGKRFYFASTGHVYGPQETARGCLETDLTNPISVYAEQKLMTENLLSELAYKEGIQFTALRIFSVFGKGMAKHYLAGRLEDLANRNLFEAITCTDDIRDFSSPFEIAMDIQGLIENSSTPKIINICSGKSMKVKDQIKLYYPNWPDKFLISGRSDMHILVGERNSLLGNRYESELLK